MISCVPSGDLLLDCVSRFACFACELWNVLGVSGFLAHSVVGMVKRVGDVPGVTIAWTRFLVSLTPPCSKTVTQTSVVAFQQRSQTFITALREVEVHTAFHNELPSCQVSMVPQCRFPSQREKFVASLS